MRAAINPKKVSASISDILSRIAAVPSSDQEGLLPFLKKAIFAKSPPLAGRNKFRASPQYAVCKHDKYGRLISTTLKKIFNLKVVNNGESTVIPMPPIR